MWLNKRLEWEQPCPECGDQMECFNDESVWAFGWFCQACWYEEPRDYYKDFDGNQVLITKQEAVSRWYIRICPDCGDVMYEDEFEAGKCIICQAVQS